MNLFIEHSGEHWWEQNLVLFVHHTTSILAKLSTWCFEHSGDISCSLLVNPSHTDESWEGRNTCMWIYTCLWIYIYIYIYIYEYHICKIKNIFLFFRDYMSSSVNVNYNFFIIIFSQVFIKSSYQELLQLRPFKSN